MVGIGKTLTVCISGIFRSTKFLAQCLESALGCAFLRTKVRSGKGQTQARQLDPIKATGYDS
jgi:hypothetical protein